MSDTKTPPPQKSPDMKWAEFLEKVPPGQIQKVIRAFEAHSTTHSPNGMRVAIPELKLFCESRECDGDTFFDGKGTSIGEQQGDIRYWFTYVCRHCQITTKHFAVVLRGIGPTSSAEKVGELPPFGPPIPTRLNVLLGEDREMFFKGRRSESQGLGVGAFSYYRRVVENQKNRLCDEIIKVCKQIGANEGVIEELEKAKSEIQFYKAVQSFKHGIPEVLKVHGHNPLVLLHKALSEGLHAKTDEECLSIAHSIRVVMTDFSEKLDQALKENAELKTAVSRLLNSSKQPPKGS